MGEYSKILYADKEYGNLYKAIVELKLAEAELFRLAYTLKNAPNRLNMAYRVYRCDFHSLRNVLSPNSPSYAFSFSTSGICGSEKEKKLMGRFKGLTEAHYKMAAFIARKVGMSIDEAELYIDYADGRWCGGKWMPHCIDEELKVSVAEIGKYYAMPDWWSLASEVADEIYPKYAVAKLKPFFDNLRAKYNLSPAMREKINGDVGLILSNEYSYDFQSFNKFKKPF